MRRSFCPRNLENGSFEFAYTCAKYMRRLLCCQILCVKEERRAKICRCAGKEWTITFSTHTSLCHVKRKVSNKLLNYTYFSVARLTLLVEVVKRGNVIGVGLTRLSSGIDECLQGAGIVIGAAHGG